MPRKEKPGIDPNGKPSEINITDGLPGIDVDLALSRIGNDRILYKILLTKFVADQKDSVKKIITALESGDRETATHLTHTLKGLAGTIGATTLQDSAGDLEMAIKDGGEALDDLIAHVSRNITKVLNGLL